MTAAILIPARYASTRFPGKPLVELRGADGAPKPLIQRSWEAAMAVQGIASVHIATDDDRIADSARIFGANVIMTTSECANGTERCASALSALPSEVDIVINLQGDAPLTPPHFIDALLSSIRAGASMATPALHAAGKLHRRLLADQEAGRVGGTTVVCNQASQALYFSKSVVPHVPKARIGDPNVPIYVHIGAYAYSRDALTAYAAGEATVLEELEGLEQLRFLDLGIPVRVVEVDGRGYDIWELNNPEDVPLIESALARRGIA